MTDEPRGEFVLPDESIEERLINELNSKYALIIGNEKPIILVEDDEKIEGTDYTRKAYRLSTTNPIKTLLSNTRIQDPNSGRMISHYTFWIQHPNRRTYEKGITFKPGNDTTPGYYNLWRGFDIKPKEGNWDIIRNHIKEVIANNDETIYQYIIKYIAHLLQKPGDRKPGVAICLRGEQGTGKGIFLQVIRKIIGKQHFMSISNPNQITGRFNDHLKDLLVLFIDESFWNSGAKSKEGILRNLITEPELAIEAKFKGVVALPSYLRVFMASNQDWIAPVSPGERRFFTIDVSNRYKGDTEYFDRLGKAINSEAVEAMLYELNHIDISNINFLDFPFTDAMWEQHLSGMGTVEYFWYHTLCDGYWKSNNSNIDLKDDDNNILGVQEFYQSYKDFYKGKSIDKIETFGKNFKKMIGPSYHKITSGLKRHQIGNLDTLRQGYLDYVGHKYGMKIFEMDTTI